VNKHSVLFSVLYTRIQCIRGGGVWGRRRGGGPQTDKHPPQVPIQVSFLHLHFTTTFGIAFYQSNLSMLETVFQRKYQHKVGLPTLSVEKAALLVRAVIIKPARIELRTPRSSSFWFPETSPII
jgi:hypothetical protein